MEPRILPPDPVPLVGGAFLRARPWVVGPMVALSFGAMARAGAKPGQLAAVGLIQGTMLVFFVAEARVARRRAVSERWLGGSLALTVAGIGAGMAASGGLDSPILPMLFAPTSVAFAAFGRGRRAAAVAAGSFALLAAMAMAPEGWLGAAVAAPWRGRMLVAAVGAALLLIRLGVAGLVEAHRQAQQALRRMGEGALEEAAARMRSLESLGARVAHEVKNPLASVKGLAALLAEGEGEARRQRRFEVLLREVARIEEVLGDYLAFARPLEALRPSRFALDELLRGALEVLEGRASAAGVALSLHGEPIDLVADRRRLLEALLNLLTNAVEAGAHRVRLGWRREPGSVVIEVEDDGRGLDPQALERLGTPFVTTREGGTGLGVALARAVARQHGGELRYESEPGRGTTARLTLPQESDGHGAAGR